MNWTSFSLSKVHKILIGAITLFYSILYFPYLSHDPLLKRDDLGLVYPLKNVHSISEYCAAVKSNKVWDVQPLRDLSFVVNLKIEDWFGLKTYHLTNLLLMIFCIHLLFKIFSRLQWTTGEIITGVLLFSCHPILVSAMGWISTRKHILGLMFILLSLNDILKKEKLTKTSVFSYLASALSHQIFILYPAWTYLFLRQRKYPWSKLLFTFMCIGGAFVLGLGYYKTFFLEMGNATVGYYTTFENIGRFILSSGRAFCILMFPNVISHSYYQGSIYNLIGIGGLVLYFYFIYKSRSGIECALWVVLAILTIIPTYIAFVNDSYLYLPLICLIISLITALRPYRSKRWIYISCFVISLLTLKTVTASRMWSSDFELWQYSYEQEKAPLAAMYLGKQLLNHNPDLAVEFIHAGAKDYDLMSNGDMLIFFVTAIYESKLPLEKKIFILEESYLDHEIYNAFYGLVLLQGDKGQEEKGLGLLKRVLKPESTYTQHSKGIIVIKGVRELCLSSFEKSYICRELSIKY